MSKAWLAFISYSRGKHTPEARDWDEAVDGTPNQPNLETWWRRRPSVYWARLTDGRGGATLGEVGDMTPKESQ